MAAAYFYLVPIRPQDLMSYQRLQEESDAIRSPTTAPIEQRRGKVQKEIWGESHFTLQAERSELQIDQGEMQERLHWVQADLQEYHVSASEGYLNKERLVLEGNVEIDHPTGKLFADRAICTLQRHRPQRYQFLGNVRLFSKDRFALADELIYETEEEMFTLQSEIPNRVLYCQEGLDLSAPLVKIDRKEGTVRGLGDVHFSFSLEEKNRLDEVFKKYL
ncbi:MAG: hypothetical protein HY069_02635 [Chlamydiia bacterium]|nr:hypothetical protein [Chlamydiia bacterium]